MKKIIFEGVGTALVTPMKNGKIDYNSLSFIIEEQISSGIDALIIGGTTGEAATLGDRERYELFSKSKEITAGRIPLIFGTGTNDTKVAVKHTKEAEKVGCDGVLVVTPYYNKGTHRGVTEHYVKIAKSTILPIILYNVPSRTGVNLTIDQLLRLSDEENIVAIKEAGDSLDRLIALSEINDKMPLYAGNDSHLHSALCLGGLGVISVISNIFPKETVRIHREFSKGNIVSSKNIQLSLMPFIRAMFRETNPSPIKYAMSLRGLCSEEVRLPLYPPENSTRELIKCEYERILSLGL